MKLGRFVVAPAVEVLNAIYKLVPPVLIGCYQHLQEEFVLKLVTPHKRQYVISQSAGRSSAQLPFRSLLAHVLSQSLRLKPSSILAALSPTSLDLDSKAVLVAITFATSKYEFQSLTPLLVSKLLVSFNLACLTQAKAFLVEWHVDNPM